MALSVAGDGNCFFRESQKNNRIYHVSFVCLEFLFVFPGAGVESALNVNVNYLEKLRSL